jgi:hypothetical protein
LLYLCSSCPVRVLNLEGCVNMLDKALKMLLTCTNLVYLNLSGLKKISDGALADMLRFMPQLTRLNLVRCTKISEAAVAAMRRYSPHLRRVTLPHNMFCQSALTFADACALLPRVHARLKRFGSPALSIQAPWVPLDTFI